ncbi:Mitochondrial carrier protein [Gigaspora margarita]|uniref:Small ribosomal subunit protein mS29 n=1 Tax=Gigaspora margarita TaxID=4874 RepID=A0A8H3XAH2_GIGMA|nr:Mitochondrial carrier protein [Gigaspora margarita]
MAFRHFYFKTLNKQISLNHYIQPSLLSTCLIVQKRTGTAKPKIKKSAAKTQKNKGFLKKNLLKKSVNEDVEPTLSTSFTKNKELYLPPPVVVLEEMLPFSTLPYPSLAIRQSSIQLTKLIENASQKSSAETRIILSGEMGVGKSALLLQTVNYALCKPWIVIYIPFAIKLVNSSYPYIKNKITNEFVQPTLSAELLKQIKAVNGKLLQDITLTRDYKLNKHIIKSNSPVIGLMDIGIKDISCAFQAFEIFLDEIGKNVNYPILLAVDVVNAFYTSTEYTDVDDTYLDPDRLSLPRTILDYFAGKRDFTYGAVIGALSLCYKPYISKPLNIALGLSTPSPWKQYPQNILNYTVGLQRFDIPNYSQTEAKGVLDYYCDGSSILQQSRDKLFQKTFIATNGNPRKLYLSCWKGL